MEIGDSVWKSRKKYNKPKKPTEKIVKNLRVSRHLFACYDFLSQQTGINATDLLEYALLSALIPTADIQLYEYITIHKSRGVRRGKKWTDAKIKALFNGVRDSATLYGIDESKANNFIAKQLLNES